jgi:hypothetical protein
MSPSHRDTLGTSLLVVGGACTGAALTLAVQRLWKQKSDPEKDYQVAHGLVWDAIGGAMNAAMLFTGDHLDLYKTLRELCRTPGSSVTAVDLADATVC